MTTACSGQPLTLVATKPADPDGPLCPHSLVIFFVDLVESEPPRFARPRPPRPGRPPV